MPDLKTRYKYIYFVQIEQKPKTTVWHCCNNSTKTVLREIRWSCAWRQYTSRDIPGVCCEMSEGCLGDIREFLRTLNQRQKEKRYGIA